MSCPFCGGNDWNYNPCEGKLVDLTLYHATIWFEAHCEDCDKTFTVENIFSNNHDCTCLLPSEAE